MPGTLASGTKTVPYMGWKHGTHPGGAYGTPAPMVGGACPISRAGGGGTTTPGAGVDGPVTVAMVAASGLVVVVAEVVAVVGLDTSWPRTTPAGGDGSKGGGPAVPALALVLAGIACCASAAVGSAGDGSGAGAAEAEADADWWCSCTYRACWSCATCCAYS